MHFIKNRMNFSNQLTMWYLANKRDLPWRKTNNPYKIWLSEIILQQTRVNQGIAYYHRFIETFPTVFHLAKASEENVLKLWQGLGYYSRARNLLYSAKIIVDEYKGKFPNSHNQLLKLKGVGDYTASAIASICFNESAAVVDGNVYRVLARYFGIYTPINSSKGVKEFKQLAQKLINNKSPGIHNQAVMEFGAQLCKPQNPLCLKCPLCDSCVALSTKKVAQLPVKEKKVKLRRRYFNYIVVKSQNNQTILQKRDAGIWINLYEFPLIETEFEIDEKDLINHSKFKNLFAGKRVEITLFNNIIKAHKLSHQHIYAKFWIAEVTSEENFKINWSEVEKYPVPVLIHNFLKAFKTN